MSTQQLAYWIAFTIPAIFICMRNVAQRLIDGPPWTREHFSFGLDLSIYCLASCLVNLIDELLLKTTDFANRGLFTILLTTVVVLLLFYQATVHQQWEREEANGTGKTVWLCVVSNLIGGVMLLAFVLLKKKEYI